MLVIISDSYLSRPTQMLWGWWLSTVRWIRAKLIQADIGWYEKNKHPMIKMVKRNCYHRAFLWSQIWTTPQLVSMGNLWWESENRKNVRFNSILEHSSFSMEDNLKLVSNFSIPSLLGQLWKVVKGGLGRPGKVNSARPGPLFSIPFEFLTFISQNWIESIAFNLKRWAWQRGQSQ